MLGLVLAAALWCAPVAQDPPAEPERPRRQYVEGPGALEAIAHFLFGTVLGWWILLIVIFVAASPFIGRYRAWVARRRFMTAQGAKLANPDNAEARFQLAEMCVEGGRWKQAAPLAEEAVRIAGVNPVYGGAAPYPYLRTLGRALYGCGRYADALDAFSRALEVKSELGYADALLGVSKARFRIGDFAGALEFAKHAVAEHESNLESYFRWAQAAAALGNSDEVRQARERFYNVALRLPRYSRQHRIRWRFAFILFPITRRLG